MANLYELTQQMIDFMSFASEEDLDEQAVKDTLEGIEGELDDKIEAYCKVILNLEGDVDAIKKEQKRLADKKKKIENNIGRMKAAMKASLDALGKREAGGLLKAKIRINGGVLPLVVTQENPRLLPERFQKVEITANNEEIRKALDDGEELSFAHFGERGESLQIK